MNLRKGGEGSSGDSPEIDPPTGGWVRDLFG